MLGRKFKFKKTHYYIAGGILAFLLLVNFVFAAWVRNAFPDFVKERNDTPYNFEYNEVDFSILGRSLTLTGIRVYPKKEAAKDLKVDFTADVKKIKITSVDIIGLIRHKKLNAHKILISEPEVNYYLTGEDQQESEKTKFQNAVRISNFELKDANFHLLAEDRKTVVSDVDKLNVFLTGVKLDRHTIEKKLPFVFSTYQINCNSFFYQINPSQEIRSKTLNFNNNQLLLSAFSIHTTDSLAVENSVEKDYRLLPDVYSKDFRIGNLDWGFSKEDEFYFKSSKIAFDSARIKISENKNKTKKEKVLGNLIPFLLAVDAVEVKNSKVEVENSIDVQKIDLFIHNIQTDKNKILKVDSVLINQPLITLSTEKKIKKEKEVLLSSPFREHIKFNKFEIRQAKVRKLDSEDHQMKISDSLSMVINNIEIIPKENYNKNLINDNFVVEIESMKLGTDTIRIFKDEHRQKVTKEDKPLIPLNLKINHLEVNSNLISQKGKIHIQSPQSVVQNLKTEMEGKFEIEKLKLSSPKIVLHSDKKTQKNKSDFPFPKGLEIDQLEVKNNDFSLIDTQNNNLLNAKDIRLSLTQMKAEGIEKSKIPFAYSQLSFSTNSLIYKPKGNYDLIVNRVGLNNNLLTIHQFELKPKISKQQFVRSLKKEKDYFAIKISQLTGQRPSFSFVGKDFFLKFPQIEMNGIDAYIYRSKIPPDDDSKKKMYSQLLRELKFGLEVNQLNIKNSKLVYEEETETSKGAGKLTFTNFNANISNINSGFRKTKLPDLRADITTNFMNESRLKVKWTFNPMNRNEDFNISGNIFNFDAKKMTPFIKPYLHATAEGNIKEVEFNFNGNNKTAKGNFGIKYNNLRATLYNPKTGKERKFLTSVGNLALKSNTKDKQNEVKINEVERKQDRSFFNFFWLCVQQGLKQTILII